MHKLMIVGFILSSLALNAEVQKYWSDTPVTCHWIGKVKRANTAQNDYENGSYPVSQSPYAQWTNHNNWADGIVPGRLQVVLEDGTVVTSTYGCFGEKNADGTYKTYVVSKRVNLKDVDKLLK